MNEKQLKQTINGYNYIEYKDGSTNIDGYRVKVTDDVRELLLNTGGMMGEMFEPIEDSDVYEVVILFADSPINGQLSGLYFKSEKDPSYKLTYAGKFINAVKNKLDRKGISYDVINTLEEIYNNPNYDLNIFIDTYVNPKSVDDTGLHLDGSIVNYDDQLTTKNAQSAQYVINKMIQEKESNKKYENIELSRIDFDVKGPNPFNLDVEMKLYNNKNEPYMMLHDSIADELGRMPTEDEYDERLKQEEFDMLYGAAVQLNNKFNKMKKLRTERRDKLIDEMSRRYDREINEDYSLSLYISYRLLKQLLDEGMLEFKK